MYNGESYKWEVTVLLLKLIKWSICQSIYKYIKHLIHIYIEITILATHAYKQYAHFIIHVYIFIHVTLFTNTYIFKLRWFFLFRMSFTFCNFFQHVKMITTVLLIINITQKYDLQVIKNMQHVYHILHLLSCLIYFLQKWLLFTFSCLNGISFKNISYQIILYGILF